MLFTLGMVCGLAVLKADASNIKSEDHTLKTCNQQTKRKTVYFSPEHSPSLNDKNAHNISYEATWDDVDGVHAYGKNGNYISMMVKFDGANAPSGYLGPQVKGKPADTDQVVFSLWDNNPGGSNWQIALPMDDNCKRNCNDCAVHTGPNKAPDGSTGTQCKVQLPTAYSGQILRLNIARTHTAVKQDMYDQLWKGDVYTVTVEDVNRGERWVVGRQLVGGVLGDSGIRSVSVFNEFLGCTLCSSYTAKATLRGPWVHGDQANALVKVTSEYTRKRPMFTCHTHAVYSEKAGEAVWISGPHVKESPGDGTWDKTVYTCEDHDDICRYGEVQEQYGAPDQTNCNCGRKVKAHHKNYGTPELCGAACEAFARCQSFGIHTNKRKGQCNMYNKKCDPDSCRRPTNAKNGYENKVWNVKRDIEV